jgi:uncharacterized membrane protein
MYSKKIPKTYRMEGIMMKKIWALLGASIAALVLVIAACEQSTGGLKSGDSLPVESGAISLSTSGTYTFPRAMGEDYAAPAPLAVVITNEGGKETGVLTVALSGEGRGAFNLSDVEVSSIPAWGSGSFTVAPVAGLPLGTYSAIVTVAAPSNSGVSMRSASFSAAFTVTPDAATPVSGIALSETGTYVFPSAPYGSTQVAAKSVTVTNTGNQPTGILTVSASDPASWTLSPATLGSIAAGETGVFTVAPVTGLPRQTHNAVITVSGGGGDNGFSAAFSMRFTVNPDSSVPVYSIALSETGTYVFPPAAEGYTQAAERNIIVTNIGNRPTVDLSVSVSAPALFELSTGTLGSIAAGGTGVFTITPVPNLPAQTHNAVVTVAADGIVAQSFAVSFRVNPDASIPVYSIALSQTGTYVFPSAADSAYTPQERGIIVTNIGNRWTGDLSVSVSDPASFTLSTETLGSIASGNKRTFTIKPAANLPAQTHNALVTVSGTDSNNGLVPQSFSVSFTVNAGGSADGIGLSETGTYVFPPATEGYGEPPVREITVTNTGTRATGDLSVYVSDPALFELSTGTLDSMETGGTGSFTIRPAEGLGAQTYNALVTVSGIVSQSFSVSFTVNPAGGAPVYGIGLSETGTYVFPPVTEGAYAPQDLAKTITVINTGTRATGDLSVSVSPAASFTLSTETEPLGSISAGETGSFTISPAEGLGAQTYNALVTVSGSGSITTKTFSVSFTVNPDVAIYSIALSETGTYVFPPATESYGEPPVREITVTNTGTRATGDLSVSVSAPASFTLSTETGTLPSIAAGQTGYFTISPAEELGAQSYNALVTVSGSGITAKTFSVSFTVNPAGGAPVYGIGLSETGTYVFPSATEGAYAPTDLAKTITVTNTGTRLTGDLSVSVSPPASFTLSTETEPLGSIAADGQRTFTIRPKPNLPAQTYNATVTVGGSGSITAKTFSVSFTVNPDVVIYSIALSETGNYVFPSVTAGYLSQERDVTVTNTGNRPTGDLSVSVSDPASWELSPATLGSIAAAGEQRRFTITLKSGLPAQTYNALVTVSGSSITAKTFTVSLTVNPDGAIYSIALSETGTYVFPSVTAGAYVPQGRDITVTNTGNRPTGGLSVSVSPSASFTLSGPTIGSIAAGGTGTFRITPEYNLPAQTHNAVVTVRGNGIVSKSFIVSFTVNPALTYGISLNPDSWTFPAELVGYGTQAEKIVTVTNTGNQPTGNLTVALDSYSYFEIASASGSYASSSINIGSIGTSGSFRVRPKQELPIRATPYTATVTVGNGLSGNPGISKTFTVSFTVEAAPTAVSGFSALVTRMAADKNITYTNYTLTGGTESYTTALTLTTANSPANVIINGGGRVVTGSTYSITVGSGVSLTLRNITFTTLPFTVATGGKLVLDTDAVVRGNAGTGITVDSGTLEMKTGALVTLNGASGVLTSGATSRFTMEGGTVSYNTAVLGAGVRIGGGEFTMTGGAILNNTVGDSAQSGNGGGVALTGASAVFTMSGGEISYNTASSVEAVGGGVVLTGASAVFTMSGGEISYNTASGGDAVGGGVALTGANTVFTMSGGEISHNSANDYNAYGGGVSVCGGANCTFTMTSGVIKSNIAGYGGGVIIIGGSKFYLSGGEISGNSAANGGGVGLEYGSGGTFNMSGGVIRNNTATYDGGGAYVLTNCTFNMTGGEITDNTGPRGGGLYLSANGTLTGDPSIGSKVSGKGSIYGNTPNDTN